MPSRSPSPPEVVLVNSIITWMEATFGDVDNYSREVPSHGHARADIVILMGDEVIAIEVKRENWKRAIAQAFLNRYCVDRSYVAIWHVHVSAQVLRETRKRGLGLLAIADDGVRIVRPAPKSRPKSILRRPIVALMAANS